MEMIIIKQGQHNTTVRALKHFIIISFLNDSIKKGAST